MIDVYYTLFFLFTHVGVHKQIPSYVR
jgi:hypothetical protein